MNRTCSVFKVVCCNRNSATLRSKYLYHEVSKYMCSTNRYHGASHSADSPHDLCSVWIQFLESHGLIQSHDYQFRTYHAHNKQVIQLRECPLCPPHKNDITNLWTLGIFTEANGGWNCFRCGNHGDKSSLIKIFNIYGTQNAVNWDEFLNDFVNWDSEYIANEESEESEICSITREENICEQKLHYETELLFNEQPLLNRLCLERNLSAKCFKDYQCGLKYSHFRGLQHKQQCITFPMYQYKKDRFVATKYKLRCVSNDVKRFMQQPVRSESGLFGFNLKDTDRNNKKIVITEGEYDSMAIYHGTEYKVKAVSVPNGAHGNVSDKIIQQLLHFYDDFVLFLDWDDAGQQNAGALKQKIENCNKNKRVNVEIVHRNDKLSDAKDANDVLIKYQKEAIQDLMSKYHVI